MRVFLDANILFSGAHPTSRMSAFLGVLFREATCLTNGHAIEEARRNLALKSASALDGLESLVRRCEHVHELTTDLPVRIEPKDIPILGGVIAGGATHLLTGDERHFGRYFGKTVAGVKIVSPRMLADEIVRGK